MVSTGAVARGRAKLALPPPFRRSYHWRRIQGSEGDVVSPPAAAVSARRRTPAGRKTPFPRHSRPYGVCPLGAGCPARHCGACMSGQAWVVVGPLRGDGQVHRGQQLLTQWAWFPSCSHLREGAQAGRDVGAKALFAQASPRDDASTTIKAPPPMRGQGGTRPARPASRQPGTPRQHCWAARGSGMSCTQPCEEARPWTRRQPPPFPFSQPSHLFAPNSLAQAHLTPARCDELSAVGTQYRVYVEQQQLDRLAVLAAGEPEKKDSHLHVHAAPSELA